MDKGTHAAASAGTDQDGSPSPALASPVRRERLALTPLSAQAYELHRELARTRAAIERLAALFPELHVRVVGRFEKLIRLAEAKIPDSDKRASASQRQTEWASVIDARRMCAAVSAEALSCLEGALLRRESLDFGVCAIADRLLEGLGERTGTPWKRLTVVGNEESFGQFGEIVRIRPDIWQLPIAVHEFGHFVGPQIREETFDDGLADAIQPFADILRRERADDIVQAFHLHEYFADMFATWAGGPAYAYVFVVLRFDPTNARASQGLHPSRLRRLELMLKTLQAMNELEGLTVSYDRVIADLRERSQASREAVDDERPALTSASATQVDSVFDELSPLLEHIPRARYDGFSAAEALADRLAPGRPLPSAAGLSILDVLNAAWRWRVDRDESDPELIAAVGARVHELCLGAQA